jgi:ABC-type Fe3+ transport system substrate-binding protein
MRRWRHSLVVVLLVAACAPAARPSTAPSSPAATIAPAAKPAATTAPAAPASPAPGMGGERGAPTPAPPSLQGNAAEWERLREAARREGKVVVMGPGFPGFRNGVVEGFQRAHGITVEYIGATAAEALTRVDREARAGNVSTDVYIGGTPSGWTQSERGQIDDVVPLLVDPAILDPSGWRGAALRLTRSPPSLPRDFHCCLQAAEWVMTDLFVNSQVVPPGALRSWKDLLKPEYKGKIASYDVRSAGPGRTTAGYLWALFGEQYLRDLFVGQEVVLTSDNRQLAEWVARGTYPIGLALVQAAIEPLRAQGLPLERAFPDDGPGIVVGGFGGVRKIKGGPNPNAAAVFVNWFASRDAQEMYEREMLETSLRADVSHRVPEYVIPKPGVAYPYDDYDPDYYRTYGGPILEKMQQILGR